jgi:nitrogen fixation/metabolism regulation signal transduction histidine kinase
VTTKAKGTGLGLAVVKKIADEHGARLRIANLSAPTPSDPGAVLARGAQVSLSFSKFAPAAATKAAKAQAASGVH